MAWALRSLGLATCWRRWRGRLAGLVFQICSHLPGFFIPSTGFSQTACSELATDVGPVIDREAFDGIQQHLQRLNSSSKLLFPQEGRAQAAIKPIANSISPAAYEVGTLAEVKDEIFGPVLQIVRWGSGALKTPEAVIEQINALGYGLTLGLQTRIDSRAQALADAAHVGNIYINRNMIGAVVGVQPFGGEGLSGTGPKAGGVRALSGSMGQRCAKRRFPARGALSVLTRCTAGSVRYRPSPGDPSHRAARRHSNRSCWADR